MYNNLLNILATLTKDEQNLAKRELPKLFHTYSETTSVIFPSENDFISFSESKSYDSLVIQNANCKHTLSKQQTADILKLIATF